MNSFWADLGRVLAETLGDTIIFCISLLYSIVLFIVLAFVISKIVNFFDNPKARINLYKKNKLVANIVDFLAKH